MSKEHKKIDVLNAFLQGENMALGSFNIFIEKVKDENIKKVFEEIQNQHKENIANLTSYMLDSGYGPKEKLGLKGIIADIMTNMHLAGEKDIEILNEAIEGEDKGINMAEDISNIDLDDDSRKVVNQILEENRSILARLKRLVH